MHHSGTMKALWACLLLSLFVLAAASAVHAEERDISVYIDGVEIEFEQTPQLVGGTTLVPLREVVEHLDMDLLRDAGNDTVTAVKGGTQVQLQEGSAEAWITYEDDRTDRLELALPAEVIDNRMVVPLRFLSEAFAYKVEWHPESESIRIYSKEWINYDLGHEFVDYLDFYLTELTDNQLQLAGPASEYLISHGYDFFAAQREASSLVEEASLEDSTLISLKNSEVLRIQVKPLEGEQSLSVTLIEADASYLLVLYIGEEVRVEQGDRIDLTGLPLGTADFSFVHEDKWSKQSVNVLIAGNLQLSADDAHSGNEE